MARTAGGSDGDGQPSWRLRFLRRAHACCPVETQNANLLAPICVVRIGCGRSSPGVRVGRSGHTPSHGWPCSIKRKLQVHCLHRLRREQLLHGKPDCPQVETNDKPLRFSRWFNHSPQCDLKHQCPRRIRGLRVLPGAAPRRNSYSKDRGPSGIPLRWCGIQEQYRLDRIDQRTQIL